MNTKVGQNLCDYKCGEGFETLDEKYAHQRKAHQGKEIVEGDEEE